MNYEERNKGLPTNFHLQNGKHVLTGGYNKIDNDLLVFLNFIGFFRIFSNDYIANIMWLHQKTTNQLKIYKNLFRLNFLNTARKNVPYLEFTAVNFPLNPKDRHSLTIDIQYKYTIVPTTEYKVTRFVKII